MNLREISNKIIDIINKTTNDYDAVEQVEEYLSTVITPKPDYHLTPLQFDLLIGKALK